MEGLATEPTKFKDGLIHAFTINSKSLLSAIDISGTVAGKGHVPCSKFILFFTFKGEAKVVGTSVEQFVTTNVEGFDASDLGSIKVTLPHQQVSSLLRSLPDAPVEIQFSEGVNKLFTLVIKHGKNLYSFETIDPEEFIRLKPAEYGNVITINSQDFLESISYSASVMTDDDLYAMNGIALYVDENNIVNTVSGHTQRVLMSSTEIPHENFKPIQMPTSIAKLLPLLKGDTIRMRQSDRKIEFDSDGVKVVTSLLEWRIPDLSNMSKCNETIRFNVDAKSVSAVLSRMNGVLPFKDQVRMTISAENESINLYAGSFPVYTTFVSEDVPIESVVIKELYEDNMEVWFSFDNFKTIFSAIKYGQAIVYIEAPNKIVNIFTEDLKAIFTVIPVKPGIVP